MAPPLTNPNPYPLLLLLLVPAALDLPAGDDSAAYAPLPILQLYTGYFSSDGGRLFGPDPSFLPRSFSLLPSSVLRTTDASLLRVSATLTVSGGRQPFPGRHLFEYDGQAHLFRPRLPRIVGRRGSVTFNLDGYYSSASGELCMVGTGSGRAADGSAVRLFAVVLHIRFPSPANLTHSFVTGRLESTDSLSGTEERESTKEAQ